MSGLWLYPVRFVLGGAAQVPKSTKEIIWMVADDEETVTEVSILNAGVDLIEEHINASASSGCLYVLLDL